MLVTVTVPQSDPTFPGELKSLENLCDPPMCPWELVQGALFVVEEHTIQTR